MKILIKRHIPFCGCDMKKLQKWTCTYLCWSFRFLFRAGVYPSDLTGAPRGRGGCLAALHRRLQPVTERRMQRDGGPRSRRRRRCRELQRRRLPLFARFRTRGRRGTLTGTDTGRIATSNPHSVCAGHHRRGRELWGPAHVARSRGHQLRPLRRPVCARWWHR